MTDANPGRVAGTINGHAGTHADIGLSDGHADTSFAYGHADNGSINRYASATHEHAGTTCTDNSPPNGYASAPARHTDAAATAYGHADLLADCGHCRNA